MLSAEDFVWTGSPRPPSPYTCVDERTGQMRRIGTSPPCAPAPPGLSTAAGRPEGCQRAGHRRTPETDSQGTCPPHHWWSVPQSGIPTTTTTCTESPLSSPCGCNFEPSFTLGCFCAPTAPPLRRLSAPGDAESSHHLLPTRIFKPACFSFPSFFPQMPFWGREAKPSLLEAPILPLHMEKPSAPKPQH